MMEMKALTFLALTAFTAVAADVPFGICSHIGDDEARFREEILRGVRVAGFRTIRFDLRWRVQKTRGGAYDFANADALVEAARREGVDLLPILGGEPPWASPVKDHLPEFADYVRTVVRRYGDAFPAYEIFNEPNLAKESDLGNPTNYFAALKTAYETIKRERPEARVGLGGVSHVSESYVRGIYALGGAKYCDFVCCHPYTLPGEPEGRIDAMIRQMRSILAEYGDAEKPIWASEVGFPTHRVGIGTVGTQVLRTGLRLARPDKAAWRAAYVPVAAEGDAAQQTAVEELTDALPPRSTAVVASAAGLKRLIAEDAIDLVVLPVGGECYLTAAMDDVIAFARRGGVVFVSGGCPLYYPMKVDANGAAVKDASRNEGRDRKALHIDFGAWWTDKDLPHGTRVFASPEALAAGFKKDPAGYGASRFLTGRNLEAGDEMVPILTGKSVTGKSAVAAAVYRLNGSMKGAVIVSTFVSGQGYDERMQALCLVRAAALARAAGAERFYGYEFFASEIDPYYSEDHFGIVHCNFAPKPAYGAYATLARAWPGGSVLASAPWHDKEERNFRLQWTRPDGKKGGMIWSREKSRRVELTFTSPKVRFSSASGLHVTFPQVGERTFLVRVSDAPVYFEGGHVTSSFAP